MNRFMPTGENLRSPLARRFILAIILASSTITLFLTAIQLGLEYRSKLRGIDEVIKQIEKVHLKAITSALWATNVELVQLQIEGLQAVPHIEMVAVREGEKVWAQTGRQVSREIVERNFPLVFEQRGRHLELGVLAINFGLDAIYAELLDHALSTLAGNALKTFLVAIFAFALFYRLLGRHLHDVTDQLRKMDPHRQEPPLHLERPNQKTGDELDEIVGAINRLHEETRASYAALRANEVNYRTLFESAADGILIVDAQGRYVDVNFRACQMLGYTREEMLTLTRRDFYTDSEAAVIESVLGSIRVGETLQREAQPKRKDGTRITVEVSATAMPDGRVVAAHRDISERKRAEESLARSEQRLRNVIDGLGPEMFVGLLSLEGTILEANRPALEAAGLKLEDVVGQPVEQTYWFAYSETLQRKIREAVLRAAAGESTRFEVDILVRDGLFVPIDLSIKPFRDATGEIVYLVPSAIVITERKRAEQALRESALQLRMAAEFGKVGLFDWDLGTNKVYFSSEWKRQIGHAEHEISDQFHEWQDRLHPEDLDRALASVQSYLADPQVGYAVEFRFRHKDGSYRWIFAQAELMHDAQGKPDRMLGSHMDITVRKHAEIIRDGQARVLALIAARKPLVESLDMLMRVVESYSPEMMASVLLLAPDGVTVQHSAAPRLPIEFTRAINGQPIGDNAGSCGTAMYRREQVIVEDINTSPLWDQYRALAQAHGLRACWSTPILDMRNQVLGSFALYFHTPRGPSPEHLTLIASIGSTASVAITSHREAAALRESEERLRSTTEMAEIATWEYDFDVDKVSRSANHDRLFGLPWQDNWTIGAFAQANHPDDRDRTRQIIQASTAPGGPDVFAFDFRALWPDGSLHWLWVRGAIKRRDSAGRGRLVQGVLVDVAERKQAEADLRESRTKLEVLARQLLHVQEAERRAIARELHDEIGGTLTAVKLNLQSLRKRHDDEATLSDGITLVDGAIRSVRSMSLDLRPSVLDDLGLVPALRWYCERQAKRADIRIDLSLDAIDLKSTPHIETACFRIVQESVTNTLRHAGARRVQVTLRRQDARITLEISDNGAGFDVTDARVGSFTGTSSGLIGMEERAKLLGGSLTIDAAPGSGTRIRAEFVLPVERAIDAHPHPAC